MWFKILYSLFFIAQLLYGGTYIGPVTPRQFMSVVMFIVLLRQNAISIDKYFKIYLVFIALFILGDVISGMPTEAFRRLLGFYFVAFTAYQATKHLILEFNGQKWLIGTILAVALTDAIVTIGFMYSMPFALFIRNYLHIETQNELIERFSAKDLETLAGWAVPGLLQPVDNGYFLCVASILSFTHIFKKLNIINYCCWVFIFFALFCVQERTAFAVGSFFSVFIICRYYLKQDVSLGKKLIFFLVVITIIFYVLPLLIDNLLTEDSRYARGTNLRDERGELIQNAIPFLISNPLGGFDYYLTFGFGNTHNLIINALVFGGWIGGGFVLYLVYKQCLEIYQLVRRNDYYNYFSTYLWGIAFICYTLNSMTHNLSIVHGDPTIWILWGAFLSNKELEEINNNYEISRNL